MNAPVNLSEAAFAEIRAAAAKVHKALTDAERASEALEQALKRRLRLQPLWNPERGRQD